MSPTLTFVTGLILLFAGLYILSQGLVLHRYGATRKACISYFIAICLIIVCIVPLEAGLNKLL